MLHSLAGLKTQKSRTKCSFVEDRCFEAYYASDLGSKRTNDNFFAGRFLFQQRYFLYENVYYNGTSI